MAFAFSVKKAAQAAAYIIKNRPRKTTKLELVKLLYFADRLSILKRGCPITGDELCALKYGPIVSCILNLIDGKELARNLAIWSKAIETSTRNVVRVKQDPGDDELSDNEIGILDQVLRMYGHLTGGELIERSHRLPEWKKCYVPGTSTPIPLQEIVKAVGRESDLRDIEEARELDLQLAHLLGR